MGQAQGSSTDPERAEKPITFYRTSMHTSASARLPYFLPEAMVNHKKMVHPPSSNL